MEKKLFEIEYALMAAHKVLSDDLSLSLGGSLALFIYGVQLDRFDYGVKDIDFSPIYGVQSFGEIKDAETVETSARDDFNRQFIIDGVLCEVAKKPVSRCVHVQHDRKMWRLTPFTDIISAKIKYAKGGGKSAQKHADDITQMFGMSIDTNRIFIPDDLPF